MARPEVVSKYYSGQGICMMGSRGIDGKPTGLIPIGNVPELTLSIAITQEDHKESWSGARGIDDTLVTETAVNMSIIMESISPENLVLGLNGSSVASASAIGATETIKLYLGRWAFLSKLQIANVVISGSVEGVDFEVDELGGAIKALTGGNIIDGTATLITFDHGAIANIQALVAAAPERYFVFNGLNTKDGLPVRLEVFRLQTQPFTDFAFINDGIAQFTVEAKALSDATRTGNGESKFFQEILATA